MKPFLLNLLLCPDCGSTFICESDLEEGQEVLEGKIICRGCGVEYPIKGGIPRILKGQSSELKVKTAKAFAYEWKKFSKLYKDYEAQFLEWIHPLRQKFFEGKLVLDAGCGTGRHAFYSSKFGAHDVVGVDSSEAVEIAYKNTRGLENVHIIQADIYKLPLIRDFDFIYSIGVLHHLPDPEGGFRALLEHLKQGGVLFAWVYGREGNYLLRALDPVREHVTSRMPLPLVDFFSLLISLIIYPISRFIYKPLNVLSSRVNGFLPQNDFFLYLSKLNFNVIHSIILDQLMAPVANYYNKEEFESWFRNAGLKNVLITWRNRNSWRGIGSK